MVALTILFSILLCLILITGLRLRSCFRKVSDVAEAETALERSPGFYLPMERLLSRVDFDFLSSQPGVTPRTLSRIRAERRKVFRQYLASLSTDFALITGGLRDVMVHSPHSRADLAGTLFRAQVIFAVAMLAIEGRLYLDAFGFHGISVSAKPFIGGLRDYAAGIGFLPNSSGAFSLLNLT